MLRKKRNEKNSLSLRQFFVLIAFFLRFSGPINGDPVKPIIDRFAMEVGVRVAMRPSNVVVSQPGFEK